MRGLVSKEIAVLHWCRTETQIWYIKQVDKGQLNCHCEKVAKLMFQVFAICQSTVTKGSNPAV